MYTCTCTQHGESYIVCTLCIGSLVGTLPTEQHRVSGEFYVVDSKTLFIEDFNYDGGGPGIYILSSVIKV